MARSKSQNNGHANETSNRLEEAMALLIQNQASFVGQMRENDVRFARIEALLMEHSRILAEHGRILERLPDIILETLPDVLGQRGAFGFRPPEQPT